MSIVGAIGLCVGSFLPWIEAYATIVHVSASGIDGGDGWITLVAGALGSWFFMARSYLFGAVVSTIGAMVASYEWANVRHRIADISTNPVAAAKVGIGIYLCLAGAVIGALAGYAAHSKNESSKGNKT
jgi:hypothetical protein